MILFNKSNLHKNHLSSKYLEKIFQISSEFFLFLTKGHFSIISENRRHPKLCSSNSFVFIKLIQKYNNLEYNSSISSFDNEFSFDLLLKKEFIDFENILVKNIKLFLFCSHKHS